MRTIRVSVGMTKAERDAEFRRGYADGKAGNEYPPWPLSFTTRPDYTSGWNHGKAHSTPIIVRGKSLIKNTDTKVAS